MIIALKKYLKTSPVKFEKGNSCFRIENSSNYPGREFDKNIAELIAEKTDLFIKSHLFHAKATQYIAAHFHKLAARKSGYTISRLCMVDFC